MPGYDHREEDTSRSIFRQLAQGDRLASKRAILGWGRLWLDRYIKENTSESVTDEEMANVAKRFPINPPQNKEEYYYRSIFEEHFPSESAARSVPSIPSVACSSAEALACDSAFKNMNEPRGRAIKDVHESAY